MFLATGKAEDQTSKAEDQKLEAKSSYLNDSESQGTFWVNLPDFASSVDAIQLQRGVGASTNGSGAFGASLNLKTEAVQQKPQRVWV